MKWIDKYGIERNYFPDFYLPLYDLYLDPKNKFAYKVQKEKIDILKIIGLIILTTTLYIITWLLTEHHKQIKSEKGP